MQMPAIERGPPAVWFPAVRVGTGADVFTERLASALEERGIQTAITWLPLRAEYAPWTVRVPRPPKWANITHVNSWLHPRFMPRALPVVTTLHSCVHDPALEPYKTWLQRHYHLHWISIIETRNLRRANAVTAVSKYTAQRAIEAFGHTEIARIHNWLGGSNFVSDERADPNQPFRLLFAGSLNRRKGAELLPMIMNQLGNAFELHYTGTEADLRRFGRPTANMKPLGRIHGPANLATAYHNCDALLFPTRLEGFGLVALEAMACGRPVIATNCTSIPEIVVDGESGILCPVDDVAAFGRAAERLRASPELWRYMCRAARQRAEIFSEEKAVSEYVQLYQRLLSNAAQL